MLRLKSKLTRKTDPTNFGFGGVDWVFKVIFSGEETVLSLVREKFIEVFISQVVRFELFAELCVASNFVMILGFWFIWLNLWVRLLADYFKVDDRGSALP